MWQCVGGSIWTSWGNATGASAADTSGNKENNLVSYLFRLDLSFRVFGPSGKIQQRFIFRQISRSSLVKVPIFVVSQRKKYISSARKEVSRLRQSAQGQKSVVKNKSLVK